jgi:uncharacterized protein (DUF433 family)
VSGALSVDEVCANRSAGTPANRIEKPGRPTVARWPSEVGTIAVHVRSSRAERWQADLLQNGITEVDTFVWFRGAQQSCENRAVTNFERITVDPAQMGGVPCVRRLRIPVATVLRLLAGGLSEREILEEYSDLELDDIRECLRFAAASAMERELPLPRSG